MMPLLNVVRIEILIILIISCSSCDAFSTNHASLLLKNPMSIVFSKETTPNRIMLLTSSSLNSQSSNSVSKDVEALLRKARELREQAEAAEAELHSSILEKKTKHDIELDNYIEEIFPPSIFNGKLPTIVNENKSEKQQQDQPSSTRNERTQLVSIIAQNLEKKKLSSTTLSDIVERLFNREMKAKGLEHVEPSTHHTHVKFERVRASPNQKELDRVSGLIPLLIDAASVLDDLHMKEKNEMRGTSETQNNSVNDGRHHYAEKTHWCSGELSKMLSEKAHFLQREHDQQFKSRLEEYYEAARKKKENYQHKL